MTSERIQEIINGVVERDHLNGERVLSRGRLFQTLAKEPGQGSFETIPTNLDVIQDALRQVCGARVPNYLERHLTLKFMNWVMYHAEGTQSLVFAGFLKDDVETELANADALIEYDHRENAGKGTFGRVRISGITFDTQTNPRVIACSYSAMPPYEMYDFEFSTTREELPLAPNPEHLPTDPALPDYCAGFVTRKMVGYVRQKPLTDEYIDRMLLEPEIARLGNADFMSGIQRSELHPDLRIYKSGGNWILQKPNTHYAVDIYGYNLQISRIKIPVALEKAI